MFPTRFQLGKLILDEFHNIPYTSHSGYQKMFSTIKKKKLARDALGCCKIFDNMCGMSTSQI